MLREGDEDTGLVDAIEQSSIEVTTMESLLTALDERLKAAGLRRSELSPDGDCFFHLLVLHGLVGTAAQARKEVVDTLEDHWDEIEERTMLTEVKETRQARIFRMRTPQKFGEGFVEREEVFAAAERYHVAFDIFTPWNVERIGAPAKGLITCANQHRATMQLSISWRALAAMKLRMARRACASRIVLRTRTASCSPGSNAMDTRAGQ